MRIALLNEGTYPVLKGGVSTWCDQLISNLDEHDFHLVTLTGKDTVPVWEMPANVTGVTLHGMWDAPPARTKLALADTRRQMRRAAELLKDVWSAILTPGRGEADLDALRAALQEWSQLGPQPLAWILAREGSTEALMGAWADHWADSERPAHLSAASAAHITRFVDRSLAVMDLSFPDVDVVHAAANGPAALIGLARHWQDGSPLLLTEHGVYLRERYLALNATGWPWNIRYAMMAFLRAVCRLAYTDAAIVAPVSEFNAAWESELGTWRDKIVTIANGVDPERLPHVTAEPSTPTISFYGRIDPLKDLQTMISAFSLVHEQMPEAKLRLFGPVPEGNETYHRGLVDLVDANGLNDSITFEGPVSDPLVAIRAGHVVALSSISEGLPFTVLEAMMAGRATVSTDVGGVSECVGRSGSRGLLVPARDPQAFADALLELLRDSSMRQWMGANARAYAMENFTLSTFAARYRKVLEDCSPAPISLPNRFSGFESVAVAA